MMTAAGMPRMPARVMMALVAAPESGYTAAELADRLGVSRRCGVGRGALSAASCTSSSVARARATAATGTSSCTGRSTARSRATPRLRAAVRLRRRASPPKVPRTRRARTSASRWLASSDSSPRGCCSSSTSGRRGTADADSPERRFTQGAAIAAAELRRLRSSAHARAVEKGHRYGTLRRRLRFSGARDGDGAPTLIHGRRAADGSGRKPTLWNHAAGSARPSGPAPRRRLVQPVVGSIGMAGLILGVVVGGVQALALVAQYRRLQLAGGPARPTFGAHFRRWGGDSAPQRRKPAPKGRISAAVAPHLRGRRAAPKAPVPRLRPAPPYGDARPAGERCGPRRRSLRSQALTESPSSDDTVSRAEVSVG